MKLENASMLAAAGWVLAWAAVVLFVRPGSNLGWILLIGAGVIPPGMILRMWRRPSETMSETIRAAVK